MSPSRAPDFIRDNVIPSVSAVRAVPFSDNYAWADASSTWIPVSSPKLPLNPTAVEPITPLQPPILETNKPTQPPTDSASESASSSHDTDVSPSTSFMKNMLQALQSSSNRLFFIQYTPAGTMRPRWFLVQLEDGNYATEPTNNLYYCTFLNRHPSDTGNADNKARW